MSILLLCFCVSAVSCGKKENSIPEITDDPVTAPVILKDIQETVPAYGIVTGGLLEVKIGKEDASKVLTGQRAMASVGLGRPAVECRVKKVLRNADFATGLAIAWLKPVLETDLTGGDFVSAEIILRVKHHVPTVPQPAVFIRDGKTMVILKRMDKDGDAEYEPEPVQTGIDSNPDVEILSGLKLQDEVVVQAGIGYLYPDFRAQVGDD
jgi:hypothetical protein